MNKKHVLAITRAYPGHTQVVFVDGEARLPGLAIEASADVTDPVSVTVADLRQVVKGMRAKDCVRAKSDGLYIGLQRVSDVQPTSRVDVPPRPATDCERHERISARDLRQTLAHLLRAAGDGGHRSCTRYVCRDQELVAITDGYRAHVTTDTRLYPLHGITVDDARLLYDLAAAAKRDGLAVLYERPDELVAQVAGATAVFKRNTDAAQAPLKSLMEKSTTFVTKTDVSPLLDAVTFAKASPIQAGKGDAVDLYASDESLRLIHGAGDIDLGPCKGHYRIRLNRKYLEQALKGMQGYVRVYGHPETPIVCITGDGIASVIAGIGV